MVMRARPRILVITSRFPYPAIGGEKVRILGIIEHLARDFDVDVFALYSDPADIAGIEDLRERCREVYVHRLGRAAKLRNTIAGWVRGWPLQVALYYDPGARRRLDALLAGGGYDLVLAHLVRTLEYARDFPGPVILEMTDAISLNYSRITSPRTPRELVYVVERRRLSHYEHEAVEQVDRAVLVSAEDVRHLAESSGVASDRTTVIPNGTDVVGTAGEGEPRTVAFLGNLRSAQNEDMCLYFAREILPLVRRRVPDVRLIIIGANPSRKVRALEGPGVIVTGEVDDPAEWLSRARVSVCPMRYGAGMQNKILESMALGVPVVTTTQGLEGIGAAPGAELLVADDPADLADAVAEVLTDPELHHRLGEAGRRFIETSLRWDQPMLKYRALVASLVGSPGGQP